MAVQCVIILAVIALAIIGVYLYANQFFILSSNYYNVDVNSRKVLFEVDEKFLSVALDISFMRCFFHKFNDSEWKKLEELSSLLAPAYLRFGGTDADRTIFDIYNTSERQLLGNISCEDDLSHDNLTITGEDWIKFNKFAQKSGLSLIVDLNVLLRNKSGWDSTNAETLIKFSEENGFPLDFQLGNEPNSFLHVFNVTVTGKELAKDFYRLRKILNSTNAYQRSKLIGPEVTRPKKLESSSLKFLAEFLRTADVVDVISWHQYYLNGRNATLEDFIDPETFNLLPSQIQSILEVAREHSEIRPIWISETSSAYGGGAPKLSNRFVASFLWLDKLGLAARWNMSVVIRQSLFKDHYALINNNLTPTPDYWISLLYKNLVGKKVLDVQISDDTVSSFLRFYGHCMASNSSLNGSIVIFGLNLRNQTEVIVPSGVSIVYPVYSYIFRSEFQNLKAKTVVLNDQTLTYSPTIVQDMLKMGKEVEYPLFIPSHSIGFWVLKESGESEYGRLEDIVLCRNIENPFLVRTLSREILELIKTPS